MIEKVKVSQAVIIVGPAWPRGGTARVMQNQVEFYRSRGYLTVFVCVPLHCAYIESHSGWDEIKSGIRELGAEHTMFASIDDHIFKVRKYTTWIKRAFIGTALDWMVFTAGSAQLTAEDIRLLRELPVALVHVNHVFTLIFAKNLVRQLVHSTTGIPLILETHDIQAKALEERGEINPWTHRLDTLDRLVQSEIAYLKKMKVLVHCSIDDFEFFKMRLPAGKHVVALPTVDESFIRTVESASEPISEASELLFVGQSTDANCAAIQWFFAEVWPIIADRGFRLRIVGHIEMLVREKLPDTYESFRSCFVGPADDLVRFYRGAKCVIAPMVSGTGVSVKTIEALALGKPFVGTSKAYRGLPLRRLAQAGLIPHDTAASFANAIEQALSRQEESALASRRAYNEICSRDASFAARDEALREVFGA